MRQQPGHSAGDAGLGVCSLLRAAAGERGDECGFGRRQRTAREPRDREIALERRAAAQTEHVELAALDLFGDRVTGEEGNAEAFARGSLDGFRRAELPDARRLDADRAQLALDVRPRARVGLSAEQGVLLEGFRPELAGGRLREPRLRDADDLVAEERLQDD